MISKQFKAFEYASYNIKDKGKEGKKLPEDLYKSLRSFSGEKDLPYYSLTANGVRFHNFVGALQVGKWTVEVLPKFDRTIPESSAQPILIQMLKQSGILKTETPSESNLKIRRNYILEAYIQMFLEETKCIIHKGLIKKYHKEDKNSFALKGNILFAKHLSQNLTHAERFYVKHTVYDHKYELNRILSKALQLVLSLNASNHYVSNIKALLLHLPKLNDIHISEDLFNKIVWSRKNEHYRRAINIARLLLLNYHPDLSHGKNNVLALMFDMNELWEKWFARRLRYSAAELKIPISIYEQSRKTFWKSDIGLKVNQKPDIVIETETGERIILDTKWKLIQSKPSEDDLRQMYTYNQLFDSKVSYLVYPGHYKSISGKFFKDDINGECGLAFIPFIINNQLSSHAVREFLKRIVNQTVQHSLPDINPLPSAK